VSRDVIDHMTIWFPGSHFFPTSLTSVSPYLQPCGDNGPQMGHDLDLSGSRDVISHVTIRISMGHFLLVVCWTQVFISNGIWDIVPQTPCAHRHNAEWIVIAPARYHVMYTCTSYVKFKYIFPFLTPTLYIYNATFIGLRWKIRMFSPWPLML